MDFIANWAFTIIQAQVEVDGQYLYVRSGNMAIEYRGRWKCIHVGLYAVFYTVSHFSLPIQSLTRYFIVCWNKSLPTYMIYSMYLFIGGYATIAGTIFSLHFIPVENNAVILERLSALSFWSKNYTYSFCYFPIKNNSQMSKKTMEMQRQLGFRIILEAIIPTFSAMDTVILCIVVLFLSKYEGGLFVLMYLPYSFVSIINCLATIIAIKNYRQTVLGWIKCSKNVSVSHSSTGFGGSLVIPNVNVTELSSTIQ
uniref:Gustatory receptor n=1 Tax=Panagrolaimus sp. PS1159 TaxID=55785 RepID=A0AC35F1Z3_9BILA